MTISETVAYFAAQARVKSDLLARHPLAFCASSMMAGAYVGAGILLTSSIGQPLDPSVRGLTLGGEPWRRLDAGRVRRVGAVHRLTMYMELGRLYGTIALQELTRTWLVSWLGNLVGSVLLSCDRYVLGMPSRASSRCVYRRPHRHLIG